MKVQRMFSAVGLALGALLVGGFALVTTTSPAQAQFSVSIAPPTLRVDVRTAQPTPGYVWIGGSWQWTGSDYVWAEGHWALPELAGSTWQAVRWTHRGNRWVSTPGRWVASGTVRASVISPQAPPRPRYERRGERPGADKVWIAGYWQWNTHQYTWVAGRWDTPEQPGATWVAPRWRHRARGWTFFGGQWRVGATLVQPQQQVIVQQPAPPAQVVYVQQPTLPAQVVVVPAQPPAVVQPTRRGRGRGRGHGQGQGNGNNDHGDDHGDDHGRGHDNH